MGEKGGRNRKSMSAEKKITKKRNLETEKSSECLKDRRKLEAASVNKAAFFFLFKEKISFY